MSHQDIADAAQLNRTTVTGLSQRQSCYQSHADAVLAVRPEFTVIGLQRRLQALMADGYSTRYLAQRSGQSPWMLNRYRTGSRVPLYATTGRDLVTLYDWLAGGDPDLSGSYLTRVQTLARKAGYAPSHTWRPGTIDNPDAIPDYTGACGTYTGYKRHKALGEKQFYVRTPLGRYQAVWACPACALVHRTTQIRARARAVPTPPAPVPDTLVGVPGRA